MSVQPSLPQFKIDIRDLLSLRMPLSKATNKRTAARAADFSGTRSDPSLPVRWNSYSDDSKRCQGETHCKPSPKQPMQPPATGRVTGAALALHPQQAEGAGSAPRSRALQATLIIIHFQRGETGGSWEVNPPPQPLCLHALHSVLRRSTKQRAP